MSANDSQKVERVNGDNVVFYLQPNWYKISFDTLITIPCVVSRYGLVPSADNVLMYFPLDNPYEMTLDTTNPNYFIVKDDLVQQLIGRWEAIVTPAISDLKRMIGAYPQQWTTVLSANILL